MISVDSAHLGAVQTQRAEEVMPLDKVIEIDGDRFYSEVVVRRLLRRSAASVRRIAGENSWDFYKKTAKGGLYYKASQVEEYLTAHGFPD